ncbi:MAG: cytochrome c oxidase subunit II [Deltaproteobacteria bacterium]|nr:cytochrome c oxidase subunit II [Deltaproteobacteria bacterium]
MFWLPKNISTTGGGIDSIILFITVTFGILFIIAEFLLLFFALRYRKKGDERAAYIPGNTFKALLWILIPVTFILGIDIALDVMQAPVWNAIKVYLPLKPDRVMGVMARQFSWEFTDAGPDNALDTGDDIKSLGIWRVPVGKEILFRLEAGDVLHSLWIPNLRLKQDAVPGRKIEGWFEATETGVYPIMCAELCGVGHGLMKGELHVLSEEDYAKWIKENS